jgi:RNA polymerase sigma factor (sigma-70 family)
MVYGLAYHRLRNFDDARDAAQDAFVSAYLGLRQLSDPAKFPAWLRRITANTCTAFAGRTRSAEPLDRAGLTQPDQVDRMLTELVVQQALGCLSPDTRLTVTLYYFQEYSTSEIAAFLDIPQSSIKSRLRDARARLKKEMLKMVETTLRNAALGPEFNEQVAALCSAAVTGDAEKARALLEADPSLVHGRGEVAPEHMEYMRQHNAHDGWTPLHLAAHYGQLDLVKLLVEHGADMEAIAENAVGNTPISAAGFGDRRDIVAYLLERGAAVDAPNAWGSTCLHRAIDANRPELTDLLLSHGADVNRKTPDGKTPLQHARDLGHEEVAALLAAKGAFG